MSFRLNVADALDASIEALAAGQLNAALAGFDDAELDPHAAVHEARKCCKRLRGLLRLARAGLGGDAYEAENAALRDAARRLSHLRDAEALIETYDRLDERFGDQIDRRRIAPVRRALVARRERLADAEAGLERRVADFRKDLEAARDRIASWPLARGDFDILAPGLKRTYKRGRKAMGAAYDAPSSERFHEWRKRVKYHRYHLELLQDVWPHQVKARRKEVKALGGMLGDEHDLAVLEATLGGEADEFGDNSARALCDLAERRRTELRRAMHPLGLRVFAERPKALAGRFARYWRARRSEALARAA